MPEIKSHTYANCITLITNSSVKKLTIVNMLLITYSLPNYIIIVTFMNHWGIDPVLT